MRPRLVMPVGDPAGVGPVVAVAAARAVLDRAEVRLVGSAVQLGALAPELSVIDAGAVSRAAIDAHAATEEGGLAQLRALDLAIDEVLAGRADAVVTGPTNKAAITRAGTAFVGQTEHLARRAGLPDDDVTMLFLGPRLNVGLVTTHLSVRAAPDAITEPRVHRTIVHLGEALARLAPPRGARVIVTGLNPHAGEDGLFGDEEPRVIAPAIARARGASPYASGALALEGPAPAEAAFRAAADGRAFGIVTMLHDQATIASKLLDWGHAVNTTWGLPFVRTSVDHGVGYEAARTGVIEASGMIAAAEMALRLVR
jgi:4-hydroxythreonine-4-phosphate dehydrogenase